MVSLYDHLKHTKDTRTFIAGETLIYVGSHERVMYVVLSGKVEILYNGMYVETVERGGIIGERSLIQYPHDAHIITAIAATDVLVAFVNDWKFKFLIHENPTFALEVMRIQDQRINHLMRIAMPIRQ